MRQFILIIALVLEVLNCTYFTIKGLHSNLITDIVILLFILAQLLKIKNNKN